MDFNEDNVEIELSLYGRHIEIDDISFNGYDELIEDILERATSDLDREEELIKAADDGIVIIENR